MNTTSLRNSRPLTAFVLLVSTGLVLSSCCTMTKGSSTARFSQLKNRHVAFVDEYTKKTGSSGPVWDAAKFQTEVSDIEVTFDRQASAEKCGPRKQAVRNSKAIFEKDVSLVREQHYFTEKGAANVKKQLDLNYDQFTK